MQKGVNTIEQYMNAQPEHVRILLEKLRQVILKAAPEAEEIISYQMPAYKYYGVLVYFAAHKNHIGFYPTGSGIKEFKNELTKFEGSKGTIRFPFDKPMPVGLITKIVKYRVTENMQKANLKTAAKHATRSK